MLAVSLVCLAILAYTYVGFPALIVVLARLRPLRIARDPAWRPSVTACIAAYRSAAYMDEKIRSLLDQDWPGDKLEILIYLDGPDPETEAAVTAWADREPRVRLVRGTVRAGKPTGLNHMREQARGEVLLLTDARQPLEPNALPALMEQLADPAVGCVTGNLVLRGALGSGAYWRYEKVIRRAEGRFRSVVGMTGSIAAVRKADLAPLPPDTVLDDVWIPMRLRLQGRRILFVDEAIAYDTAFDDDKEFGRKARTLYGNFQLFARMPGLLSPFHNPSWFETVSHKLLRLVCPWALIALLAASVLGAFGGQAADGPERTMALLLLAGQGAFYLGALLGGGAGKLGALARTFVVMNAAAVVGFWRWVTGGQRVTW